MLTPTADQLASLLRGCHDPSPLRICSGGTTTRCAADHHWTIDLSQGLRTLELTEDRSRIRFGSGWTMGDLQEQLARHGRMLPTGLSGLPGAGFLLTGGMGPLSRSVGLAIDHLDALEGVWGTGEPFSLQRHASLNEADSLSRTAWRGLLGAAIFLGVVRELEMLTLPQLALDVVQGCVTKAQLIHLITAAEGFPTGLTLQWSWCERIEVMLVARRDDPAALEALGALDRHLDASERRTSTVSGLHQLPAFGALSTGGNPSPPPHQEVVGLLGPRWGEATETVVALLQQAIATRPHPRCNVASQQLGGAVGQRSVETSAFLHRQAEWKPWISASWSPGNVAERQQALAWLEALWERLLPWCPGIHLAQLHDHLPWHQRELEAAFGSRLGELRALKQRLDPAGRLPQL